MKVNWYEVVRVVVVILKAIVSKKNKNVEK